MSSYNEQDQSVKHKILPYLAQGVTVLDIQRIREERRNRPSKVAFELDKALRSNGSPLANTGTLFLGHLVGSIERLRQEALLGLTPTFYVDTITCPLYRLEGEGTDSEFGNIHGVSSRLESESRYEDKFQRFLATLATVKGFFSDKDIKVRGRAFFGDAGVINTAEIKAENSLDSDEEIRTFLRTQADEYTVYFKNNGGIFGLSEEDLEFHKLTDIAPDLARLPIDLNDIANALGINTRSIDPIDLQNRGVAEDVVRSVMHQILLNANNYGASPYPMREILGFMVAYGVAGKAFANSDTGLFVSLDKPSDGRVSESYRHSMYFAFLQGKGMGLPLFIPSTHRKEAVLS